MGAIKDYIRTALNGVTVYTKKLETKLRKEFDTKLKEFDTKLSDKADVVDIVPQVQSDWNNVDKGSLAHILNRPFYDDIVHKTYTFYNVPTSGQAAALIGYIDGKFVEGKSYVVTVNGTEYNFTAADETHISDGSHSISLDTYGEFRLYACTWWSSGATVSISGPIHILKRLDGKFIDGVTSLNGEIGDVTIDRDKLKAAPIDYEARFFYNLNHADQIPAYFDWIGDDTEHGTGLVCGDTYIFNKYDGDTPILCIFNSESAGTQSYYRYDSILRGIESPKYDNDAASKKYVDNSIAGAGHIKSPATETVGQILAVKSVNSLNKPTEWETVDMPQGGEEKPWRLLDTIDFSIADNQLSHFDFTDLGGVTDILLFNNGTQNDTETASGYTLAINGTDVAAQFAPSQKKGTTNYWWAKATYDGMAWIANKSAGAVASNNTTMNANNDAIPYCLIKDVGKADSIRFIVPNPIYKNIAGTWEIWVR